MLRAAYRRLVAQVQPTNSHIITEKAVKGKKGATRGHAAVFQNDFNRAVRGWREALAVAESEPIPALPAIASATRVRGPIQTIDLTGDNPQPGLLTGIPSTPQELTNAFTPMAHDAVARRSGGRSSQQFETALIGSMSRFAAGVANGMNQLHVSPSQPGPEAY